jgi:hypothetical protein
MKILASSFGGEQSPAISCDRLPRICVELYMDVPEIYSMTSTYITFVVKQLTKLKYNKEKSRSDILTDNALSQRMLIRHSMKQKEIGHSQDASM